MGVVSPTALPHTRDMKENAPVLFPLAVVAVGIDWCGGWLFTNTYILPLLSQIGF